MATDIKKLEKRVNDLKSIRPGGQSRTHKADLARAKRNLAAAKRTEEFEKNFKKEQATKAPARKPYSPPTVKSEGSPPGEKKC